MGKKISNTTPSNHPLLKKEQWLIDSSNLAKKGLLRIAVVFPNSYFVAMSNLGFHFLLRTALSFPGVGVERFFLSDSPEQSAYSFESQTHLRNFPLIFFSVSSELDYINVLRIIQASGIPIFRDKRTPLDPLLVAGGFAISMNPLPLAKVVDVFIIGDGEYSLPELIQAYIEHKGNKEEIGKLLASRPGFYVPEYSPEFKTPTEVYSHCATNVSLSDTPITSVVLTPDTEFSRTFLIELSRGCPYTCKFCFVGHNKNPWRWHLFPPIATAIESAIPFTNRIGLVASAMPPQDVMNPLLEFIQKHRLSISVSSLRINDITEPLITTLVNGGQRSITLAPECGREELRFKIGKPITDEQIFSAFELCLRCGIKKIKCYFLIGLPEETDKDIRAIAELLEAIQHRFARRYSFQISAGVGIFTPRPGTPMTYSPFCGIDTAEQRLALLRKYIIEKNIKVTLTTASPTEAAVETLLGNYSSEAQEFLHACLKSPDSWRQLIRKSQKIFLVSE